MLLLQDYGITIESKGNELIWSRWQGNLKGGLNQRTRGIRSNRVTPIAANFWTMEEPMAQNCALAKEDDYVIFVGGIPPGHFELRRAMKEYALDEILQKKIATCQFHALCMFVDTDCQRMDSEDASV